VGVGRERLVWVRLEIKNGYIPALIPGEL